MATRILRGLCRLLPALLLVGAASVAQAATITIINDDGAGEGFNDPTAAAPVGGNPGTTIGEQRLNVFQRAAEIWGAVLPSNVTIQVLASFDPLSCTATGAVLGSAGAVSVWRDFPNAPYAGTWYSSAEADKLADTELDASDPDIRARFNSNLGNTGCLTGSYFYYGFDNNHGTNVDLLVVVLHELAHGLGFQTFASGTTGAYLAGYPDIFLRYLRDQATGLRWHEETDAQRVTSAINTGRLLWDAPGSNLRALDVLQLGRPDLKVNAPAAVAGDYMVGLAVFGPALTTPGVTADVVLADDGVSPGSDACTALTNAAQLAGKIAMVDRGTCTFAVKVKACQDAGAIGVIVVDNAAGSPPAGMGGADATITIPSVRITLADGTALKAQLASGLNATIGNNPTLFNGADDYGRVMMYAPNPFQSGSSVSHWDVSCVPNLLMEPNINTDLTTNLDMTPYLLDDIGWGIGGPVATTLAFFTAEGRTDGILLRWEFSDPADIGAVGVERSRSALGPWSPISTDLSVQEGAMLSLDREVEAGVVYFYRLMVTDTGGEAGPQGLVSASRLVAFTGPAFLARPTPNPTASGATIAFRIGRPEFVRLFVTDASGRRIRTLQEGMLPAGEHSRRWDGRTDHSSAVPAGVYFVSLRTSEGVQTQRVAIVR